MSNRGGMTSNPFAGFTRLDKVDLIGPSMIEGELVDVASNIPPERILLVKSVRDAVFNYLYFGLGRNGTSAEEFWFGAEYLFRVRASKPETWRGARTLRVTHREDSTGRRVTRTIKLTDDQLAMMCIDRQWECLEFPWGLDKFLAELLLKRGQIVDENWMQITGSRQPNSRMMRALIQPVSPKEMEALMVFLKRKAREELAVAA